MYRRALLQDIGPLLPSLMLTGFALITYRYQYGPLSHSDLEESLKQGKKILTYNGHAYDISNFYHPGGDIITQAIGHDISKVWESDLYAFHRESKLAQDTLQTCDMGKSAALPSLDPRTLQGPDAQDNTMHRHDLDNEESKMPLDFDKWRQSTTHFLRNHGRTLSQPDAIKFHNGNKTMTLAAQQIMDLPKKTELVSIICGGAGRGTLPIKTSGTPWGGIGADAILTMQLELRPLAKVLEAAHLSNSDSQKEYLIQVSGSDGYTTVLHSSEIENFSIAFNSPYNKVKDPRHHYMRLIGRGTPGFRNIKYVEKITRLPMPSPSQVDEMLRQRLGDTMQMLPHAQRAVLAHCPSYDAYILRDIKTKKPFAFYPYNPVSSKITKKHQDAIEGIAYSQHPIKNVSVCDTQQCKTADLSRTPNGDGRFVLWKAQGILGDHIKVNTTDSQGFDEPSKWLENSRGLCAFHGQEKNVPA